jgi:two-component system, sporulation sensor kinase E
MKLSVQITMMVLLLIVLTTVIGSYLSLNFTSDILQDYIEENQFELAKEVMSKIDLVLFQRFQEIKVIADSNPVEDAFNGKISVAQQRLDEFSFQTGPWDVLSLIDIDKKVLTSTDKSLNQLNQQYNLAFNEVVNGNFYHSDLIRSLVTGRPTMIFAAPVFDEIKRSRDVVGVVVGEFSWPVIIEKLDELDSPDRHMHLFNEKGLTIAAPSYHRDEILNHDLTHLQIIRGALDGNCGSFFEPMSISLDFEHEHEPSFDTCYLQQGHLTFRGNGWGLLIETKQSSILAPLKNLTRNFLLVGFLVILLSLPLAFILSRTISKPLNILIESNKSIIEGKYEKAQQQQQQQQQHFLSDEIRETLETRQQMLKNLVGKKELDKKNKELQGKIGELEKWEKLTVGRELRISELKKKVKELQGEGK